MHTSSRLHGMEKFSGYTIDLVIASKIVAMCSNPVSQCEVHWLYSIAANIIHLYQMNIDMEVCVPCIRSNIIESFPFYRYFAPLTDRTSKRQKTITPIYSIVPAMTDQYAIYNAACIYKPLLYFQTWQNGLAVAVEERKRQRRGRDLGFMRNDEINRCGSMNSNVIMHFNANKIKVAHPGTKSKIRLRRSLSFWRKFSHNGHSSFNLQFGVKSCHCVCLCDLMLALWARVLFRVTANSIYFSAIIARLHSTHLTQVLCVCVWVMVMSFHAHNNSNEYHNINHNTEMWMFLSFSRYMCECVDIDHLAGLENVSFNDLFCTSKMEYVDRSHPILIDRIVIWSMMVYVRSCQILSIDHAGGLGAWGERWKGWSK